MKFPWFTFCVVVAVSTIAFLWMTKDRPDRPGKPATADSQPKLLTVPFEKGKANAAQDESARRPEEPANAAAPAAEIVPVTTPNEIRDDNGLELKLVWCPPGSVTMESVEVITESVPALLSTLKITPVKAVLKQGYWLGQYEVTQSQWKAVMKSEPWKSNPLLTKDRADSPATYVSWADAVEFCRRLTEHERGAGRLSNDWEYTLPTEAQWERACRAGTETSFSFGDDESKLGEYAWFYDNAANAVGEQYAHRVGQKKANPWGLCDMHGNVWEWCRDVYTQKLPGGRDPEVMPDEKTQESHRVRRGGGWGDLAALCRAALRGSDGPSSTNFDLGLRVALSPAAPAAVAPQPESLKTEKLRADTRPPEVLPPAQAPPLAADPRRGKEAGEVRDDNGLKLKFVWCPPGTFKMGSPPTERGRQASEDQVEVTLTQGYWLGQCEVTQAQWKELLKTEPWKGQRLTKEGADLPATSVSWDDAVDFCRKLTEQERQAGRMANGWECTLPTEAQWERACRAGTETRYSFGDDESKLGEYAWFASNVSNTGERYARPVGQKKPNPWGLYDMHGNVK